MTPEKSQDRTQQKRKDPSVNREAPQEDPPEKEAPEKDPPPEADHGKMYVSALEINQASPDCAVQSGRL